MSVVNPRRACAERVKVIVLCVCVCVCVCVCMYVCVCLSAHAILAVRAIKSVTKDTFVLNVLTIKLWKPLDSQPSSVVPANRRGNLGQTLGPSRNQCVTPKTTPLPHPSLNQPSNPISVKFSRRQAGLQVCESPSLGGEGLSSSTYG